MLRGKSCRQRDKIDQCLEVEKKKGMKRLKNFKKAMVAEKLEVKFRVI